MKHYLERIALLRHRYINPSNSNHKRKEYKMQNLCLCLDDIAKKSQKWMVF